MSTYAQPSSRFNEAIAKIAEAKPVLVLQQALQLSDTAFRVTASHAPYKQTLSEADYNDMVAAATDNNFRLFPDTLQPVAITQGQRVLSFIIEANTAVENYDEEKVRSKMRVLATNLFVDETDNKIWRVVENGDQKYLVQSVREDFAALLGSRLAKRSAQVVSSANYPGMVPANGDYVQFYNTAQGGLAFGFVLSSDRALQVAERQSGKLVKIMPAHVVAAVQGTSLDNKHSLAQHLIQQAGTDAVLAAEEISPAELTTFLDYMRTLYADTDYFLALERLVKDRRSQPAIIELFHE